MGDFPLNKNKLPCLTLSLFIETKKHRLWRDPENNILPADLQQEMPSKSCLPGALSASHREHKQVHVRSLLQRTCPLCCQKKPMQALSPGLSSPSDSTSGTLSSSSSSPSSSPSSSLPRHLWSFFRSQQKGSFSRSHTLTASHLPLTRLILPSYTFHGPLDFPL